MDRLAALAVFVVLGLLGATRADAAAEFCPATLVSDPVMVDGNIARFRLGAISPRVVSGFVRLQTAKGWYAATFSNVPLRALEQNYNDQGMTFSHEDYLSEDFMVKMPARDPVLYAYVAQAQAQGDTFLNWDRFGTVDCSPTPFSPKDKRNSTRPVPALSKSPIQLSAAPIPAPFESTCAEPFSDVLLTKPGPFHYPAILGRDDPTARPTGVTVVVVAVNRDGSVVDAWVWEPIGTPMLDQAVVDEARKATYAPGKAFCQNVPGYFVLRSVFTQ
jgi:hypothetical protein